jgi:branched-chain amino acid transport system substrate-binding protein
MGRVYVSLPLSGPIGAAGRDVLRGAELALERRPNALEAVVLDSFADDGVARATANARLAAEDGEALAYLGDYHSSQVSLTAPILGAAGLLQVVPVATRVGLGGDTLVRLMPDDAAGAGAIAGWMAARGVRDVLIVHDHDHGYGIPVGALAVEAARNRAMRVRSRPVWDHDERPAADLGNADAVLYVGVAGSGAVALWHELHAARPAMWLLGSDGLAVPWLAQALQPSAAERTRLFTTRRASLDLYGHEAIELILDAVDAGGGARAGAVAAARRTRERDSILGRYSVDESGAATLPADGCLTVVAGRLAWAREPA